MLTVTAAAKEKLKESLKKKQITDPEMAIRIILSSLSSNQFEMSLDKEKKGDQVVKEEDRKVLLIGSDLGKKLNGMVLDFQEASKGASFTISSKTSWVCGSSAISGYIGV